MQIWSTNSRWFQIFKYEANHFCNIDRRGGKCLDVQYGKDAEGQPVLVLGRSEKPQQRWNIVYLDEAKELETKGLSKTGVSTSTDHSTLDLECHSKGLLSATVATMFG
jgi:hypothetical protein